MFLVNVTKWLLMKKYMSERNFSAGNGTSVGIKLYGDVIYLFIYFVLMNEHKYTASSLCYI